jgi:hypothetical protein
MRIGDLDGIALGYVDGWARSQAKITILDEHFERQGLVDAEGNVDAAMRVYFTAINSARLALNRLSEHLAKHGVAGGESLQDYIDAEYGSNGDADA